MNWAQIRKNVGWRVQLQPVACRIDDSGRQQEPINDDWIIEAVVDNGLRVKNVRTHHVTELNKDHLYKFTTDSDRTCGDAKYGFLTLTVQIFLRGDQLWKLPTFRPGERLPLEDAVDLRQLIKVQTMDKRFEMIMEDFKRRGTPQPMIDAFDDFTQAERADLYERVVTLKHGRPPKRNPYKSG
jgi:hypothetical protein